MGGEERGGEEERRRKQFRKILFEKTRSKKKIGVFVNNI